MCAHPDSSSGTETGTRGSGRSVGRRAAVGEPPAEVIDAAVKVALEEDVGSGDVTSRHAVPAGARARARLVSRATGVLAGLPAFARAFERCDPSARVVLERADGESVRPGELVGVVEGDARALLAAERTALNLLQHLSGVATRTARFVALVAAHPGVRILDTRKTTPGLRALEKYAVRCGGGENHRAGLWDEAMLKENHLALAGRDVESVVADLRRSLAPGVRVTCEARDAAEARAAVRAGADVVLLDNMTPSALAALCPELRALARELGRTVELEASGGMTEDVVAEVAAAGVDRISIGAITHSAPALDLSLYLDPMPSGDGA